MAVTMLVAVTVAVAVIVTVRMWLLNFVRVVVPSMINTIIMVVMMFCRGAGSPFHIGILFSQFGDCFVVQLLNPGVKILCEAWRVLQVSFNAQYLIHYNSIIKTDN